MAESWAAARLHVARTAAAAEWVGNIEGSLRTVRCNMVAVVVAAAAGTVAVAHFAGTGLRKGPAAIAAAAVAAVVDSLRIRWSPSGLQPRISYCELRVFVLARSEQATSEGQFF